MFSFAFDLCSFSLSFYCCLRKDTKLASDFNQGTGRVIFCNLPAYRALYVYLNLFLIRLCTTKDSDCSLRIVHLILSPLIVHKSKITPQGSRSRQENVNLVPFHIASHTISPALKPPLCASQFLGQLLRFWTTQITSPSVRAHLYPALTSLWLFWQ